MLTLYFVTSFSYIFAPVAEFSDIGRAADSAPLGRWSRYPPPATVSTRFPSAGAIVSLGSNSIRAPSGPHHPSECSADGRFRPTFDLHQPPPADGSPVPGLDGDCCQVLVGARFSLAACTRVRPFLFSDWSRLAAGVSCERVSAQTVPYCASSCECFLRDYGPTAALVSPLRHRLLCYARFPPHRLPRSALLASYPPTPPPPLLSAPLVLHPRRRCW